MIESMAAGTPVIALRRGSVPEIVADGVTGFICDDIDDMRRAVDRVADIDPDDCRRRARQFSSDAMCAGYLRVYEELVASVPADAPDRGRTTATSDLLAEATSSR
jgi:glycosyltransferase involved in cell wall biosynthesis